GPVRHLRVAPEAVPPVSAIIEHRRGTAHGPGGPTGQPETQSSQYSNPPPSTRCTSALSRTRCSSSVGPGRKPRSGPTRSSDPTIPPSLVSGELSSLSLQRSG